MSEMIPDATTFKAVMDFFAVVGNPAAAKAFTLEIQRQCDQLRDAQAKLSAEVTAVTRRSGELDIRSEQLDRREAEIRRREVAVHVRENELAETARLRGVAFDPRAAQPVGGSGGMTREIDPTEGEPADAHFRTVQDPHFTPPAAPVQPRAPRTMRRVQA